MLAVLAFFGPLVNKTPIASLAGLLLVLANDLIDRNHIRTILRGTLSDRAAFLVTLLGAWVLPLDKAIYLGVGISIVLFLRRARLLSMREMVIGEKGRFREIDIDSSEIQQRCTAVRILNLTGPLFFAAAGELETALDARLRDASIRVLILRVRQVQGFDVTTVSVLETVSLRLASQGRTLLLLGLRPQLEVLLANTHIADSIGQENLFPAQAGWFTAMEAALQRALTLVGEHGCGASCPLVAYLTDQHELRQSAELAEAK
jgi:SulP family sulfate permease